MEPPIPPPASTENIEQPRAIMHVASPYLRIPEKIEGSSYRDDEPITDDAVEVCCFSPIRFSSRVSPSIVFFYNWNGHSDKFVSCRSSDSILSSSISLPPTT